MKLKRLSIHASFNFKQTKFLFFPSRNKFSGRLKMPDLQSVKILFKPKYFLLTCNQINLRFNFEQTKFPFFSNFLSSQ